MVQFPDKCESQNGITQTKKGAWSGTQLGPRIIDIGAGVFGLRHNVTLLPAVQLYIIIYHRLSFWVTSYSGC